MIEWHMEGIQFGGCHCDHACPGPIFEGGGELQLIVDDRASEEPRHDTVVQRIEYEVDVEA